MEAGNIRKFVKCCITEKPLINCKTVNAVSLNYKATWTFPTHGNILLGTGGLAMAFVHDDCLDENGIIHGEIINAVEFIGNKVIYHSLQNLEKVNISTERRCRICGCTDLDCSQCIKKQGFPCFWVADNLCSACTDQ